MASGLPALFHRGAGQRGEPDDIADCIDVRHVGLKLLVAADAAAIVDFQTGVLKGKRFGVARPPDAKEHGLSQQPLSAFELDGDPARLWFANTHNALAQTEDHAERAGVVHKRFDNFPITKFQELRASIDDRDLY